MRLVDRSGEGKADEKLYIVYKKGESTSSQPLTGKDAVETYNRLKNDGFDVVLFHLTPSTITWSITILSDHAPRHGL
jgi:hypothetical protein